MRTKRANRYNSQSEHNQFGIYNWFRLTGISDKEVIKETLHCFCEVNGFEMNKFSNEKIMFNWVANRFQKFAPFAGKFLRENNYIDRKEMPVKEAKELINHK